MRLKVICFISAIAIYIATCPHGVTAEEKQQLKCSSLINKQIAIIGSDQIICYESTKYFIVAREVQGRTGTDFLVKYKINPKDKLSCNYNPANGDFEIKNEWAEYFSGLKNDLLILDSTTGPGPSGLIIWDLTKRKKVYEGYWTDSEDSGDNSLVYWMETGEATHANCPELEKWHSQGLEAARETKVILNLSNFQITKTNQTRCSPRQ
jgi:hypothetical protein